MSSVGRHQLSMPDAASMNLSRRASAQPAGVIRGSSVVQSDESTIAFRLWA